MLVIWFTGLPCSGKTTLAKVLIEKINAELLDGDVLRNSDFSRGVGFSPEERERHLLRVGFLAKMLSKYTDVVCSFVSPSEEVRQKLPVDVMIYVKCPASICSERDVKGMWAKAKLGEIKNFTGYDAPFDPPRNPDLVLETDRQGIDECIEEILKVIERVRNEKREEDSN